ncbi:MAG: hypothetical protein NTV51_26470 [Verrucomicrobia bacterium]|nr:hypothetical protein [Verrucomicrobiota bacterium]
MSDTNAPWYFVAGMSGFLTLGMFLLAYLGGWRNLAKRHLCDVRPDGKSFGVLGAWLGHGGVRYGWCIRIIPTHAGIYVYPWIILRPFHPHFFSPWDAITLKQDKDWLRGEHWELTIDGESEGLHLLLSADAEAAIARFRQAEPSHAQIPM